MPLIAVGVLERETPAEEGGSRNSWRKRGCERGRGEEEAAGYGVAVAKAPACSPLGIDGGKS